MRRVHQKFQSLYLLILFFAASTSCFASPELDITRPFKLNARMENSLNDNAGQMLPQIDPGQVNSAPTMPNSMDSLPTPDIGSAAALGIPSLPHTVSTPPAPTSQPNPWPQFQQSPTQVQSDSWAQPTQPNQPPTTLPAEVSVTQPDNVATAAPQANSDDQNNMTEYGVDWSGWLNRLGTRWHAYLSRLKQQSGLHIIAYHPAVIQFTCYPNGQITDVTLLKSSGVAIYDQMQMDALLRSQPAPPFPPNTRRSFYRARLGWDSLEQGRGNPSYTVNATAPLEIVKQWLNWH